MRTRKQIEKDPTSDRLFLEVLLDIRDQNEEIKKQLKEIKDEVPSWKQFAEEDR